MVHQELTDRRRILSSSNFIEHETFYHPPSKQHLPPVTTADNTKHYQQVKVCI